MICCATVPFLVLLVFGNNDAVTGSILVDRARNQAPELFLKATDRAAQFGYLLETHYVVTDDGYILCLHRIPGDIKDAHPVLLQHGQAAMSDTWLAFGPNRSLGYQLADRGFDVWLGNNRGNIYSRNHTTLDPSDPAFWRFSGHEMGIYDLPATIDYILTTTGARQLDYIGYSMGGRVICVLLSLKPEYNQKIRQIITMAPGVFNSHMTSRPVRFSMRFQGIWKTYMDIIGRQETSRYSEETIAMSYFLCGDGSPAQILCENLLFEVFGESSGMNKADIPLLIALGLGGNSVLNTEHYFQLIQTGDFQPLDHGLEGNQLFYNSTQPPEYDLKKITVPVEIHYGASDALVSEEDAEHLSTVLPNVVKFRKVPAPLFNHIDFISHTRLKDLLNDEIINSIENKRTII